MKEYGSMCSIEPPYSGRGPAVHKQKEYVQLFSLDVKAKNPAEPEFHQAARKSPSRSAPVLE